MSALPSHRSRRGFSLVEMGWVLAVLGVLAIAGAWGWGTIRDKADSDRPTSSLANAQLVQTQALLSRGSFADTAVAMASLEGNHKFVNSSVAATALDGVDNVSVGAVAGSNYTSMAYAAALSDAGICFGLRIPDPRSGQAPVQVRRTPAQAPVCSADQIAQGAPAPW